MFRLKGKGVKNLQGYGHGDLHVRINVEVPTHLTAAQKAKLQEFAELCSDEKVPDQPELFREGEEPVPLNKPGRYGVME